MSAALLDDLLADFIAPTHAKAAILANREDSQGIRADAATCERLRILANPQTGPDADATDSQAFAEIRSPAFRPESEQPRGFSQDSQDSQGVPTPNAQPSPDDLNAVAWSDGDIARFLDRRARLMRWRWPEAEAERLASRLVRRDREADPRVSCVECQAYKPGWCRHHRRAGLGSPEVGPDLAALLQHCPGFKPV